MHQIEEVQYHSCVCVFRGKHLLKGSPLRNVYIVYIEFWTSGSFVYIHSQLFVLFVFGLAQICAWIVFVWFDFALLIYRLNSINTRRDTRNHSQVFGLISH